MIYNAKTVYTTLLYVPLLMGCYTPPQTKIESQAVAKLSGNYVLDPTHASLIWSVSHSGLSQYQARFDDISGKLDFNAATPNASRVDIRIDPMSVSTGLTEFDKTIATDKRYFDATNYPEIRFTSNMIEITGDMTGLVTGDLTFRGVTKPITLDVRFNGAGKSFGHAGDTLGFSATGEIDRTEFGLTYLSNFGIGKNVTLRIEAEFNEVR